MRHFFASLLGIVFLVVSLVSCQSHIGLLHDSIKTPSSHMIILGQKKYQIQQQLNLINEGPGQPEKENIWVALIHNISPYQEVQSMTVSPADYVLAVDEYDNQYAEFDFSGHPGETTKVIRIIYQVVVNELAYDLRDCEGQLPDEFTQPELHIESANPQIVALSNQLSRRKDNACQKARAFYDYLGDQLVYGFNNNNWGAQASLGQMGADCTEYTSLFVALSRAQKIPARYYEGLLYLDISTRNLARVEHAWADVYLPGVGWVAVDPTLGRTSLFRDTYFAHHTPDHIIVTQGVNPSTLRGSHYWTHIYWPGNSTKIRVEAENWKIDLLDD